MAVIPVELVHLELALALGLLVLLSGELLLSPLLRFNARRRPKIKERSAIRISVAGLPAAAVAAAYQRIILSRSVSSRAVAAAAAGRVGRAAPPPPPIDTRRARKALSPFRELKLT